MTADLISHAAGFVLDTLPVAIVGVDDNMRIVIANPTAETLFGRSAALLRGRRVDEILSADSELLNHLDTVCRTGGTVSARAVKLFGPTIATTDVDVNAARSQDSRTVVASLTPTRTAGDIDSIRETDAMAEVARILGHEVKNPLAGIVGAAQLLARKARPDQQALLTLIKEEGARIGRIVDRFAAFETFFHPRHSTMNIHLVLDRVVQLARNSFAADIEISREFDPSLPELQADPDHLHEAFLNIVKNASEALAGRTGWRQITLTTRYRTGVRLRAPNEGGNSGRAIEVSIRDNGPGVPSHVADRIFSPFFTTKQQGAGIGLAVVAEIVAAHGGLIELENSPQGACFRITLPLEAHFS